MVRPDALVAAVQERLNEHLPRVITDGADRPVKILVRRGAEEGTALVRLWYEDRGTIPSDYEPGRQLVLSASLRDLANLPDLAFADWLVKAVNRLLRPNDLTTVPR